MRQVFSNQLARASRAAKDALSILGEAHKLFVGAADRFARQRLALALGVVAGAALLTAAAPVALKLAIDALASARTEPKDVLTLLLGPMALVLIYAGSQYLARLLNELRQFFHGQAEQRLRRHVGLRLFDHLVRLPLRFHLERKTGAIGETAEQGIRGYQLLLTHAIFTILPVAIELIAVTAVLLHLDHAKYIAVIGLASIAYVIAFHHGAIAIRSSAQALSRSHIDSHAILTDSLLNYETIKYFDAEPVVSKRYDSALVNMESAWRNFYARRLENGVAIATIFALSLGVSLYVAARDVAGGTMTVGDFVLLNAYVIRIAQPLEMLGFAIRDVAQGSAFLQALLELLREARERDSPRAEPGDVPAQSELTFDHVSFGYRSENSVLSDLSFTVPAGSTVALVGASGSGKTTIIRLLFRLYQPDFGHILLDNKPIEELPLSYVRRAIAVVPQDTVLFHDTIANNIGFGRSGASQADIEEAARLAHLDELVRSLPQGYDTVVGERGLKLSGGERQRVAIARAALKRPRIYVFDEATSSLDSRTEAEILRNLSDVAARCTTLVIAHRLSTIVHADQILVLDRGVICERGRHEELLKRGGLYAALWQAQRSESRVRTQTSAL